MEVQIVLKFVSLVLSIWFGLVILFNGVKGHPVHWPILLIFSTAMTLFIFLQWNLF